MSKKAFEFYFEKAKSGYENTGKNKELLAKAILQAEKNVEYSRMLVSQLLFDLYRAESAIPSEIIEKVEKHGSSASNEFFQKVCDFWNIESLLNYEKKECKLKIIKLKALEAVRKENNV